MKAHRPGAPPASDFADARRRVLGLLVGGAALLAGCGGLPGGPRPSSRDDEDIEFTRFSRRGYDAVAAAAAYPYRETWPYGDDELALNLLVPRGAAPSPLVLYLPGLGESVEAGETWRRSWAHAGYAVACVQTVSGAAAWSASAARNGDFGRAAREQFAVKALAARSKVVEFVLAGMARRAKAGDGVYSRIDTGRVALAGFDLGAQTALALGGERHPDFVAPSLAGLRAILALSPQAILARGGFAERFGAIRLPTLSVTGSADGDPYGIVDNPHTRQAPFRYMPPGDKYLLVIEDGTHQMLAGSGGPLPGGEDAYGGPPDAPRHGGRREPPGGMGRDNFGGGPSGMGGPGGRGGGMGGPGGMPGGPPDKTALRRSAGRGMQRQLVIVERVSVAFLDATVKDDPVAREWLLRDAVRWSDPLARLEMK